MHKYSEINKKILEELFSLSEEEERLNFVEESYKVCLSFEADVDTIVLCINFFDATKDSNVKDLDKELKFNKNVDKLVQILFSLKSIRLIKNLIGLKNEKFTKIILEQAENKNEWLKIVIMIDIETAIKYYEQIKINNELKILFFRYVNIKNLKDYISNVNEEIYNQIINRTKIHEFNYLFSINRFNEHENLYSKIKQLEIKNRFQLYESINVVNKENKKPNNLLKRLVERNIDIIGENLLETCFNDPIVVIDTIIDNILRADTILKFLIILIQKMPVLIREIFYYRVYERFTNFENIIYSNVYSKSYLSFVDLLVSFNKIDDNLIENFLFESFENKNYVHAPLLEKYLKLPGKIEKIKNSDENCINKWKTIFDNAKNDIFNNKNLDQRLKYEIADKYFILRNYIFDIELIKTEKIYYDDLKFLLESEIKFNKDKFDIKEIVEKFLKEKPDDFFVIKNFILLIRARDDLFDERIFGELEKHVNSVREDLKVLSNSCISILKIRERKMNSEEIKKLEEEKMEILDNETNKKRKMINEENNILDEEEKMEILDNETNKKRKIINEENNILDEEEKVFFDNETNKKRKMINEDNNILDEEEKELVDNKLNQKRKMSTAGSEDFKKIKINVFDNEIGKKTLTTEQSNVCIEKKINGSLNELIENVEAVKDLHLKQTTNKANEKKNVELIDDKKILLELKKQNLSKYNEFGIERKLESKNYLVINLETNNKKRSFDNDLENEYEKRIKLDQNRFYSKEEGYRTYTKNQINKNDDQNYRLKQSEYFYDYCATKNYYYDDQYEKNQRDREYEKKIVNQNTNVHENRYNKKINYDKYEAEDEKIRKRKERFKRYEN